MHGGRWRIGPITVVAVAGEAVDVEDAPLGQRAVAAQIKLARADAADRHADAGQLVAAIDLRLPLFEKAGHPGRSEMLIGRDVMHAQLVRWSGRGAAVIDDGEGERPRGRGQETATRDFGRRLAGRGIGLEFRFGHRKVASCSLGVFSAAVGNQLRQIVARSNLLCHDSEIETPFDTRSQRD